MQLLSINVKRSEVFFQIVAHNDSISLIRHSYHSPTTSNAIFQSKVAGLIRSLNDLPWRVISF